DARPGQRRHRELLLPRRSRRTPGPGCLSCLQARRDRADHQRRSGVRPRGIRINAVCPGTIETQMAADMIAKGELDPAQAAAATPIARLGQGEEIAASVLWLCSPGASFVVGVAL